MSCVLVVDPDVPLREFLSVSLAAHGYRVLEADSGEAALECTQEHDAVLLGVPQVTRTLREWTSAPILVTGRDDEETLINALDAGADDFLAKPFRMRELLARLRAALRRHPTATRANVLRCGPITLDQNMRFVTVNGRPVNLTPNEFGILEQLMLNQGHLVSHRRLLQAVWGESHDHHLLRVHVSNLRKKTAAACILNEPGLGYRLQCAV